MRLQTHGTTVLRAGRAVIETDYHAGDGGPGVVSLRLEDQETGDAVEGQLRLDPWSAYEYPLIEFRTGNALVICGAQAIVTVDVPSLTLRSSLALGYEECDRLDAPWHAECEHHRLLVLATERRVWCIDQRGAIRWIWGCQTTERDTWITAEPIISADRVRVSLRDIARDVVVDLRLRDGLPT